MLRLRDIMTSDVLTLTPEATIREAMEVLAKQHVSGAPVVSGGKLVGIVSATDLMAFAGALSGVPTEREAADEWIDVDDRPADDEIDGEDTPASAFFTDLWDDAGADVTGRIASSGGPEWNALEEHDVSEVMTHTPLETMMPAASVEAAADLMRRRKIHRVLVVEGDRLVGIVSASDIVAAAADHRFTSPTLVFGHSRRLGDTF